VPSGQQAISTSGGRSPDVPFRNDLALRNREIASPAPELVFGSADCYMANL
jgi:hypothetical protein